MWTRPFKLVSFLFLIFTTFVASQHDGFLYNGFGDAYLSLDGSAHILPNGLLSLTNHDNRYQTGHGFYFLPLQFKNNLSTTTTTTTVSFSTTFVFAIDSEFGANKVSGQGMAFVIAPFRGLPGALPNQYLGLFNESTNGKSTNHVIAVELDTVYNVEFDTVQGNHVGININGLKSVKSTAPRYFTNGEYTNLSLTSGEPLQVWVEYDGIEKQLSVTLAPINVSKPNVPLLSLSQDLSPIFSDTMYVGFSASTQTVLTSHYLLGWSFRLNGKAQALNLSSLPQLPQPSKPPRSNTKWKLFAIIGSTVVLALLICVIFYFLWNRKKANSNVTLGRSVNGTEQVPVGSIRGSQNNGLHIFAYNVLSDATRGFSEKAVIGRGGFGKVYRGVLPNTQVEVAVKKMSHDSGQGSREFFAEIDSIGKLQHRNIVQLYGYCEHEQELLLVYEFMPNGSVDKFLYPKMKPNQPSPKMLNWRQRFKIIKGVASGLSYLHEGWEQVVIHRDIKASNVLLDGKMNAKLGDFGLAKLYDHDMSEAPLASRVAGTKGYIAPEMAVGRKATKETDVYAFGVLLLEIACGRRPAVAITNTSATAGDGFIYLVHWVLSCWNKGAILQTRDQNLDGTHEYVEEEMELVLHLGLLCSHTDPKFRPCLGLVMHYLYGNLDRSAKKLHEDLYRSKKQLQEDLAQLTNDLLRLDMSGSLNLALSRAGLSRTAYDTFLSAANTGSTSTANNEAGPSGTY